MDENNFKYILLGLGIGIILTNILYYINPRIEYESLSDQDIIKRAEDLGMVTLKENILINEKNKEINYDNKKNGNKNNEELKGEIEKNKEDGIISFQVEKGDDLYTISEKLYKEGLINKKKEFEERVYERELSKKMHYGIYEINFNSDYDSIIDILIKK